MAIQKNAISPFATAWIDPEGTMLRETSQSEKDKSYRILLMCGI